MKTPELQWDTSRDEPYLQLRPGFRLTPARIEDVVAKNAFWNTEDVRISMPDNPKPYPLQKTEDEVKGAIRSAKQIIEVLKRGERLVAGCPLRVVRRESDGLGSCGTRVGVLTCCWCILGLMSVYPCEATRPIPIRGDFDYAHPWTNGCFQLGYALIRGIHGQGLSTEMVKVFIDGYLRPIMGLRAVGAITFEANAASRAVLRETGFREIYRWTIELPEDLGGGSRFELNHVKDLM